MERSASSKIVEGSAESILKPTQASEARKEQDKHLSQGAQVAQRKLEPEWLGKFYRRSFFTEHCSKHTVLRNELNKYCIDCDESLCQFCVPAISHSTHRLLKIYQHVFTSVVPFKEITQHINCEKIQPYRCNKRKVIALSPLPHLGSETNAETTCKNCKRKLIAYDRYDYCSISCQVKAFMATESDAAPTFLLCNVTEKNSEEGSSSNDVRKSKGDSAPPLLLLAETEQNAEEESSSKKTRKRKGTPHRAPFF